MPERITARFAPLGIDRRLAAVTAPLEIVADPQRLRIPRRHHMHWIAADLETIDYLEGCRI